MTEGQQMRKTEAMMPESRVRNEITAGGFKASISGLARNSLVTKKIIPRIHGMLDQGETWQLIWFDSPFTQMRNLTVRVGQILPYFPHSRGGFRAGSGLASLAPDTGAHNRSVKLTCRAHIQALLPTLKMSDLKDVNKTRSGRCLWFLALFSRSFNVWKPGLRVTDIPQRIRPLWKGRESNTESGGRNLPFPFFTWDSGKVPDRSRVSSIKLSQ